MLHLIDILINQEDYQQLQDMAQLTVDRKGRVIDKWFDDYWFYILDDTTLVRKSYTEAELINNFILRGIEIDGISLSHNYNRLKLGLKLGTIKSFKIDAKTVIPKLENHINFLSYDRGSVSIEGVKCNAHFLETARNLYPKLEDFPTIYSAQVYKAHIEDINKDGTLQNVRIPGDTITKIYDRFTNVEHFTKGHIKKLKETASVYEVLRLFCLLHDSFIGVNLKGNLFTIDAMYARATYKISDELKKALITESLLSR